MSPSAPISIRTALERSWEVLRSEGLHSLWLKILGETVYRRMDIYEWKVSPQPAIINLPEGFEISLMKTSEVDEEKPGKARCYPGLSPIRTDSE